MEMCFFLNEMNRVKLILGKEKNKRAHFYGHHKYVIAPVPTSKAIKIRFICATTPRHTSTLSAIYMFLIWKY